MDKTTWFGDGNINFEETEDQTLSNNESHYHSQIRPSSGPKQIYKAFCIFLLLVNYFLAQYDKFILSYFRTDLVRSLPLSEPQYAVLSGYATGIVYALAAIPVAYLADTLPRARVWVLAIAALWWSLCVIFQSLSHNFWQILLARIGMGLGQSCVEPLSISLISDLSGGSGWASRWRNVFLGASVLYVGVYIGEAISGQIATAFTDNQEGWRVALRAIGITGIVVAVILRLVIWESSVRLPGLVVDDKIYDGEDNLGQGGQSAKAQLTKTLKYLVRMRSFWLLLLSASIRQLAGNVFGYYMPGYLQQTYSDILELLSRYGIIVGVVGSVSVLSGGALTSLLWNRTKQTPLWLTGVGGMVSSLFVLLMLYSRDIADGDQRRGVNILYGTMSMAYLTAELWLGAINGLIASLLPPKHKTFGLAIFGSVQVLIYSSGPEIVGLALRNTDSASEMYRKDTQLVLAVIIPLCYWLAAIGFLSALPLLRRDYADGVDVERSISKSRTRMFWLIAAILVMLVLALFVASIVLAAT